MNKEKYAPECLFCKLDNNSTTITSNKNALRCIFWNQFQEIFV